MNSTATEHAGGDMTKNGVVLIHGAWHGKATYDAVVPELKQLGVPVVALDLPGAGENAAVPSVVNNRPLDPAAAATELSPNAGVSQADRTSAVIEAVRKMNAETGGKAYLLGHSLGGLTVTDVAEQIPDEISGVIYLTAFMLTNGIVAGQMIEDPSMEGEMVKQLFLADPMVVGAGRMDVKSDDPDYLNGVRQAFYADLTDDQFTDIVSTLHPDEPGQVFGTPSAATPDNYGTLPRTYICCTADNAIPIAGQRAMIERMDQAMGSKTSVMEMGTSHSPFISAPSELAGMITQVMKH